MRMFKTAPPDNIIVYPTCGYCKYWYDDYIDSEDNYKPCHKIINSLDRYKNEEQDQRAKAICYSESTVGELITTQDFGCILFELK
ncbi:MAG: hypothetical protein Q8910_00115 [Bacteroidota bacterium]|nr:hypothetical protein [Bacteroidota bacterium]